MRGALCVAVATLLLAGSVLAQEAYGVARLDPESSALRPFHGGGAELVLALSAPVRWRVATLEAPRRLVVDFRDLDWSGVDVSALLQSDTPVTALRAGALKPGWSRLVLELATPQAVLRAGMEVAPDTGAAFLTITTAPTSPEAFAARAGLVGDPLRADLARRDTVPQSRRLQQSLIDGLGRSGARLTAKPERRARLAVLMAADFPSVLVETGFLSNEADRAALQTPQGRAPIIAGLVAGLRRWAEQEAALAPLRRR